MKEFKKLPPLVQIAVIIIVVIIIYVIVTRITTSIRGAAQKIELQQEQQVYESAGQTLSYPSSQYRVFADTLQNSDGVFDDDEDSIYSVFRQMNNDLDVIELEKKYRAAHGRSISDFLVDVFYRYEIDEVNAILDGNNITRRY